MSQENTKITVMVLHCLTNSASGEESFIRKESRTRPFAAHDSSSRDNQNSPFGSLNLLSTTYGWFRSCRMGPLYSVRREVPIITRSADSQRRLPVKLLWATCFRYCSSR